jgi:hypothetical protein
VIPADNKWYARIAAAGIIADAIIGMKPAFPEIDADARAALLASRAELIAEDPDAAAAEAAKDALAGKGASPAKDASGAKGDAKSGASKGRKSGGKTAKGKGKGGKKGR